MTIYKTAYDTSACSGFRLKDTQDKVEKAMISSALRQVSITTNHHDEPFSLFLLEGGNSAADAIPYFNHPLRVHSPSWLKAKQPEAFALDVRPFGKWYAPNEEFVVRNEAEYGWAIKRAVLNEFWITQRPEILRDISPIPVQVYSWLLSECIARRFALEGVDRIKTQVLAAYFYHGLFSPERNMPDEMELNKMVGVLSRITRVPADKVYEYIENIPLINDLTFLCESIKAVTGSVALQDLNLGTLTAITSGTWYGTNARENLAVGLEHAPTWIMAVAASLDEATFKRSQLAKISAQFDRQGAGQNFLKTLNVLLGGADVVERLNAPAA